MAFRKKYKMSNIGLLIRAISKLKNVLYRITLKKVVDIYNYEHGYYYYHSFPFNSQLPLAADAIGALSRGCEILDGLGVKYFLSFGTLLGIVRDKQLILHDSDIDVAVLYPVDPDLIEEAFLKKGFKIGQKARMFGKTYHITFYNANKQVFDVTFYVRLANYYYAFCEPDCYFKFPADLYANSEVCIFNDREYPVPYQPEKWLEYTYGPDWKTPKKAKAEWREDYYGMKVNVCGSVTDEARKILTDELGLKKQEK